MTTLWRYMDWWKFQSILDKGALFLATAESQEDKLEGVYPLMSKILRAKQLSHLPPEQQSYALHNQEVFDKAAAQVIMLSCWHINNDENPRMWDEYLCDPEGIAIQTSRDALTDSFSGFSHPTLVEIVEVKYINRTKYNIGRIIGQLEQFFYKDESFTWENELRCAIDVTLRPLPDDPGGSWNARDVWNGGAYPSGLLVPISVNTLIERIVVSPNPSAAFLKKVENMCNKHGLSKPIEQSSISC